MNNGLVSTPASPPAPRPTHTCGALPNSAARAAVTAAVFGQADGKEVKIYTLTNTHGIEARISTYGATTSCRSKTPDRDGRLKNTLAGFDRSGGLPCQRVPYYGATVGRYANRVAKGRFTLDGTSYQLPP